ncbi:hypothetical protein C8Q80DRAFT_1270975 [Daedaleopsis nitida]|nr:hypothetical protein C8Q80DRAFT_1270975 [Daedaleopsis nitida]
MLAASRVCKMWCPLALELLHKYVLLKSAAHLLELSAALHCHEDCNSTSSRNIGRRTVRLELALEGDVDWREEHTDALAHIITACPNITVFSTAHLTSERLCCNPTFRRSLGFLSNLKRLELNAPTDLIVELLSQLGSSLHFLWLRHMRSTSSRLESCFIDFPCLKALVIAGNRTGPPPLTWSTPALRMLSFAQGHGLGSTQMRKYLTEQGAGLQHFSAALHTSLAVRLCSNLTECALDLNFVRDDSFPHSSTLRRLIIFACDRLDIACTFSCSFVPFHNWLRDGWNTGQLPSLANIRFLLPIPLLPINPFYRLQDIQRMQELIEECKTRGVALEASVGADEHTANIHYPLKLEQLCQNARPVTPPAPE